MTVNPATVKLTSKGQTAQLSASVLPNNAENKSIVWSTSNASVATVDNNGVVTAVANGNATITASAADGSEKNGICNVIVEVPSENAQIIRIGRGRIQLRLVPQKLLFQILLIFQISQLIFKTQIILLMFQIFFK